MVPVLSWWTGQRLVTSPNVETKIVENYKNSPLKQDTPIEEADTYMELDTDVGKPDQKNLRLTRSRRKELDTHMESPKKPVEQLNVNGEKPDLKQLPITRSGRKVVPVLSWWMGQRLVSSNRETKIIQNHTDAASPLLCSTKVCFLFPVLDTHWQ